MVIIGFSDKTSKIIVQLVCGHFKHCAIITKHANKFVLHQFVKRNYIEQIIITKRHIAQLELNGWVFIYLNSPPRHFNKKCWTCVSYAKHAIGIKNLFIQTPNSLYKYLKKSDIK